MESTAAQVPERRRSIAWVVALAVALAAALAVAVVGLVRSSSLSSKVDRLATQLVGEQTTIGRLQKQLAEQRGVDAGTVKGLESTVKKLQARVKLYDTCVPEIMGQINSLSADVVSTGPLYVLPTQTVSHFCQPILFGSGSPGG